MKELTLAEIKQTELEILEYIDRVCKENDIEYFLFAGTLLGAVRHKGFIPWDDDIDLFMTRENYDKFISVTRYNSSRYVTKALETDDNYLMPFIKVIDSTTLAVDTINKNPCKLGVWVDIFPLDEYKKSKCTNAKRLWQLYKYAVCIGDGFNPSKGGKGRNYVKRVMHFFYKKAIPRKCALKIQKIAKKYNGKGLNQLYVGVDLVKGNKNVVEKAWLEKAILLDFEGKLYPAPIGYDEALTRKFGDYMTPPPEDKRVTHNYYKFYDKE
jgi:lipopolysaccharide cholinephosphotransferase